MQFKVYSGYYYVLAVIFLFSGVYRLSKTGWVRSFKLCWGSQRNASTSSDTLSAANTEERDIDSTDENDSEDKALLPPDPEADSILTSYCLLN